MPVLLVDDNSTLCWLHQAQLEVLGVPSTAVNSAQQALDLLQQRRFGLIVIDLYLDSDFSGFKLIEVLRQTKQCTAPLVGLTGVADLEHAKRAGLDDCYRKPLMLDDWKALVDKWYRDSF